LPGKGEGERGPHALQVRRLNPPVRKSVPQEKVTT
jgi:hypothetical protein